MTKNEFKELSFEDYAKLRAPAVNAVVNDYAAAIYADAKKRKRPIKYETAVSRAKKNLPELFVPEWMKNLRVIANARGTEVQFMREILDSLNRLEELVGVVHEGEIEAWIAEHKNDFKRLAEEG